MTVDKETTVTTIPSSDVVPAPTSNATVTTQVEAGVPSSPGLSTPSSSVTTTSTKPGYRTSEFWAKIAVDVAATVLLIQHDITSTEWAAVTGGTTGIYALVRAWTKTGA